MTSRRSGELDTKANRVKKRRRKEKKKKRKINPISFVLCRIILVFSVPVSFPILFLLSPKLRSFLFCLLVIQEQQLGILLPSICSSLYLLRNGRVQPTNKRELYAPQNSKRNRRGLCRFLSTPRAANGRTALSRVPRGQAFFGA